jgi:hypothetical protein
VETTKVERSSADGAEPVRRLPAALLATCGHNTDSEQHYSTVVTAISVGQLARAPYLGFERFERALSLIRHSIEPHFSFETNP